MWHLEFNFSDGGWSRSDYDRTEGFDTLSDLINKLRREYPNLPDNDYYLTRYRAIGTHGTYLVSDIFANNLHQEETMPTPPTSPTPVTSTPTIPAAQTQAPAQDGPLVETSVVRDNQGRLVLNINAARFHEYLDSIGARHDGQQYLNPPPVNFNIVSGSTLSSRLFLRREYPMQVNLSGIFSQPPTVGRLKDVAMSTHAVVRSIIEHYQPVDIKVTVLRKAIK